MRAILAELGATVSAETIWIAAEDEPAGAEVLERALGHGQVLRARCPAGGEPLDREAAMERAARALRAAARRWSQGALPSLRWPEAEPAPARERVIERIRTYLLALAEVARCTNVLVARGTDLVAAAREPTDLERARIAFAVKRVEADADRRDGTSHGEVVGDDLYVRSFYFDASLVAYFDGPWGLDFVRHRARQVCRELAHLLAMLEPTPPSDTAEAPIPE